MSYKNKEKGKLKSLEKYYRNRKKKLEYQRKYDKEHKEKKREQDRKRRETTNKNKIRVIQAYSRKHHFPKLLKIYKGCQLMLVDCLKTKKLELHHRKYTKKFMDCVLLCQNCHKKIGRKR